MIQMPSSLSRRSFLTASLATFAHTALASSLFQEETLTASQSGAAYRASGATAKITTKTLRNNVTLVEGSGGNILLFHGSDGKITVDSGLATSEKQVRAALNAVSQRPLTHLLNTHWHFDHTDGNLWMHAAGATIVAQKNTRTRMSSRQVLPPFSMVLDPSPVGALPTVLFEQTQKLELNGGKIVMERYTPAHTDTDVSVFFEDANVLHVGDTWFNGYYPFIDYDSGGSIKGLITASDENLKRIDNETLVVPGHGSVGNRADLVGYQEMLVDVFSRVEELKMHGYTIEDVIQAKPSARYDHALGGGFVGRALFCDLVYRGI